jgi:PAS domain S-box-containing protein
VTVPATAKRGEETRLLSYQPARDEAGEIIGVSVASVDITERRRAEAALRESEDHYRHMVELNPQIPWVMNSEGENISVSSRWEGISGQTAEQTTGYGWLDATHPDDRQHILDEVRRCLRTGEPIDLEYRVSRDGKKWHWTRSRGAPRRDAEGRIVRWYGSVECIDDQKQAQEELRRNQAQLQAIFDNVPVGIILASAPDGKLVMANPEAKRILRDPVIPSYSLADYSKWGEITVKGKRLETSEYPLARALGGEKTRIEEALCLRGDGSEVWLSLLGAPILREDATVEGCVVVLQDINDLRLERQRLFSLAETLIRDLRDRT